MRLWFSHDELLTQAMLYLVRVGSLNPAEPECDANERHTGRTVRVTLEGGIPAVIYLSPCYRDQWIVSIALWPTLEGEVHMGTANADGQAGEVFAFGWVNRWQNRDGSLAIEWFENQTPYMSCEGRKRLASVQGVPSVL